LHHLVRAILGQEKVTPIAADFHDGYVNAILCDALLEAAKRRRYLPLKPVHRRANGNPT
jgi:hypothetical protein